MTSKLMRKNHIKQRLQCQVHQIKRNPLTTTLLALAILSTHHSPADAQWQGTNERTWAQSINSDIMNGGPMEHICTSSLNSATISDEVGFKNWAYGIARQYCSPDKLGKQKAVEFSKTCDLKVDQINRISRGQKVIVYAETCSMSFN